MQRTIHLLEKLSPLSPVFRANREVLLHAQREVKAEMDRGNVHHQWRNSPRTHGGDLSAAGTPRYLPDTGSTASSFSAR
jgi:hypothetical protein